MHGICQHACYLILNILNHGILELLGRFQKPWMGEGGLSVYCFMTYPSEFRSLQETHDYNVPIYNEEKGFVCFTHNRVGNEKLVGVLHGKKRLQ